MIQTIPKFKVKVQASKLTVIEFGIHDTHLSNVLRVVASMDFGPDLISITVERVVPGDIDGSGNN